MPSKKKVTQKQKQRQSVTVNISLAKTKARAKSSAKKSGAKGGARGSIMMLPPPIYASPIDKLTPSMYGAQGQQIQQRSMEELLKNFLTNPEKQTTSLSAPNKLGSAPASLANFSNSFASSYPASSASSLESVSNRSSSNATANSSSRNSLTDYGSVNSPSLNSLAYFPNNYSDSSFSSDSLNPRTASTSRYSTIPSSSGLSSFSPDSLDANPTFTFMDYYNSLESQRPKKRAPEELEIIKEKYRQDLRKTGINDVDAYLNLLNPQENAKMQRNLNNIKNSKYDDFSDNVSEMTDPSYMSDFSKPMSTESQYDRALASPFSSVASLPIPFQNEQKTYLKVAEPDYEINDPKFSQNEAKVSQGNIYESSRRPDKRPPVRIIEDDDSTIDSSTVSSVPNKKRMPIVTYDDSSVDSLSISSNPFPERLYNKMMGI